MEVDVDAVTLAKAQHQVARDPELVGCPLRALAEDLELPLALGDLGVDALDVDACLDAEVDVGIDDLARDLADVLVADACVVLALRGGEAFAREAERHAVAVEEVLLLEAEPGARVVRDRRAAVRRMRGPVREEHFAHDEQAVRARRIGERRDGLQQAVRVAALGLPRRAAVEAPDRQVLDGRRVRELHDLRLAAEVRNGLVPVEPDVFELDLHRVPLPSFGSRTKKGPRIPRNARPHCLRARRLWRRT